MAASTTSANKTDTARKHLHADRAEKALRALGQVERSDREALLLSGQARMALHQYEKACEAFDGILQLNANDGAARGFLASALLSTGQISSAIEHSRRAVGDDPELAAAWGTLGLALFQDGNYPESESALERARALSPDTIRHGINLIASFEKQGKLVDAEMEGLRLLEQFPDRASVLIALGNVYSALGEPERSIEMFQKARALDIDFSEQFSGYLFSLHYTPGVTEAEILQASQARDRILHAGVSRLDLSERNFDPERKLRVGFLGASFSQHPVGIFILSPLHFTDNSDFEFIAYDNGSPRDNVNSLLRREFGEWVDIAGLSDQDAAERINEDNVDILIDLIGYSERHRMGVLARKPAPVQVKWVGGQLGTTGLASLDCFITDHIESPEGTESVYSERLVRLPDDYVCYTPPGYAPPVNELSAFKTGYVTFGSLNKLAKVNDELLEVWARVLDSVPESRLSLRAKPLQDEKVRERLCSRFASVGGDPSRLELRGPAPHDDFLRTYEEIDIGLDTWPYSGGLTTCEALWMGVPVVSREGGTFAGRHSKTHLCNAGLSDWVVQTADEYVARAVSVASDLDTLANIRRSLRATTNASPLCDGPRFARHLADGLRFIWRQALGVPAESEWESSAGEETPARGGDVARIRELVRQAEQMLVQGNVDSAGKICLAAIKAAPGDPDVRCLAGLVNLSSDRARDALQHFESALTARPWEPRFNLYTAEALTAAGEADRGEALTEVATRLDGIQGGGAGEDLARVMALLAAGETRAAAAELRALMESDPDNRDAALLYSVLNGGDEDGGSGPDAEAPSSQSEGSAGDAAALPSAVIEATVNAPDGRELSIAIPRRELFRLRNIFQDEEYALPQGLSPADVKTVVDVGANVGGFALYARGWGEQVTISCFEPNPQVLGMLEKNLADEKDVRVFPFALGAEEGEITLYQHPRNTGQSSVSQHTEGARPVPVAVEKAEAALAAAGIARIDVLKIDTEGSEVPILEGMGPFLRRTAVAMMEYHSEADRRRIDELMAGFQLYDARIMGTSGVGTVKYFNPAIISFASR